MFQKGYRMAGGIKIVSGSGIKVINCGFSGLNIGIDAENCEDLVINGNHFNDVISPVKATKVKGLKAKNNIDHSSRTYPSGTFRYSREALLVSWYINTLRGK